MRNRLLILGGGIKGSALAALMTLSGDYDVTLVDRKRIGSGTTSTNHGRLHLGTSGWRKESFELIQRRRQASELVRLLPTHTSCPSEGVYCFEDDQEGSAFSTVCEKTGIPAKEIDGTLLGQSWVNPADYAKLIQVPEFSFNPARLAGRFAQTCVNSGGKIISGAKALRITPKPSGLTVDFEDGSKLAADVVVNTMTRWSNELSGDVGMPRLEIKWFRWRLLCLRSEVLRPDDRLEHVIVVMDRQRKTPSAIPHRDWITLDYSETELEEIPTPEGDEQTDWRPMDLSDRIDAANFEAVRAVFRPIQSLASSDRDRYIYSMAGVHGRLMNAKPGSVAQIVDSESYPRYFVTFGGQASTGLLDALEIVEHLGNRGLCRQTPRQDRVEMLRASLAEEPWAGSMGMAWENATQRE